MAGLAVGLLAPPAFAAAPSFGTPSNPTSGVTVKSTFEGAKSASGRLAQSDPALLKRTDSQIVSVMVKLDLDPVASYAGGIAGLAATSPSATGQSFGENKTVTSAYTSYVLGQTNSAIKSAKKVVSGITVGQTYLVAYGGFEARLPANQAKNLLKVPGVVAVQSDAVVHPDALDSANFVGATQVWPSLGGDKKAGQGVKFADLDTGIWPENPMLADNAGLPAPSGPALPCNFGTSGQPNDAAFSCNHKLIGAYAFVDTNLAVNGAPPPGYFCNNAGTACSARDGEGHGTHTATTAAGDVVQHAVLEGVDRGPASGIAPGAEVIMYRVCIQDSCYQSDSVAAVQQAIIDGADVINFSIGGSANAYSDPVELAFLDAFSAGIAVNASAGNSGPGAATAEHGGPWETTVGASTLNRSFNSTLHLTANGGATLNLTGVTITSGITSPTPVILASDAPYSAALCDSAPSSGSLFSGKIVVCERGNNGRIDKGHNAYLGGAAGFILYNQSAAVTDLESDNHFLPAIQVQYAGNAVANFVANHTNVKATWAAGSAQSAQGDVMASFSSRGPAGGFIKPDVTAPGVQILAGNTPFPASVDGGKPGENYQAIAGTSMSSPHASGVSLLLKAAHPSWTPGQIKSALMTSSVQSVVKENGSTKADPFDRGAGSIRANRAIKPTVTFEVQPEDFYQAGTDELHWVDLNLPSIDADDMDGVVTTTRTAENVTNKSQTLVISTSGGGGAISVTPTKLVIPAGQSGTFTVRIDASGLDDGQYFGQITLDPKASGATNAVLPVAFNKQASSNVSFSNECDSTTIAKGDSTSCEAVATNYTPEKATVTMRVAPQNGNIQVQNYSPATRYNGTGWIATATLDPALPPPVLSLDNPADDGFFDLSPYLAPLTSNFASGDESILNLGLTYAVRYGDRTYSTIGAVTDGYVVVGGGDSGDVNYIPQDMPDSVSPNNVIAPYWTDLNFEEGGDFYVGLFDCISSGDHCAYEFEWKDVPIYGTTDTRSFAVWMYTDDFLTSVAYPFDNNEMAYDTGSAVAGDAGTPLNVGAEDALGLTAAQLGVDNTGTTAPDADGYYVVTGTSAAGGSLTIDYDVYGAHKGKSNLRALLDSNVTVGTAKHLTTIHVTP
ncbi:MAG TPA: S8 family serine peptidase [Candidatus Limnocylindrales bacterium]